MNKIILVHYINVNGLSRDETGEFMKTISENLTPKEEVDIISYYIPIAEGETRVECLNPKLVSENDFMEAKRALDKMKEMLSNITSNAIK